MRTANKRLLPLLLATLLVSNTVAADSFDEVKKRYTAGSMYLTYTSLLDLHTCLKDRTRWSKLKSRAGSAVLKEFLAKHHKLSARESLGLFHLDLGKPSAGYKMGNDSDASMTQAAFSEDEIKGIAVLIDEYVRIGFEVDSALAASTAETVDGAVNVAKKFASEPLVSPGRVVDILAKLKKAGETDSEGMRRLQRKNRDLYDKILDLGSNADLLEWEKRREGDKWDVPDDLTRLRDATGPFTGR